MAEFRYTGLTPQQKRITGYIEVKNKNEAKSRIALLSRQKGFTLSSIQKKSVYLYKVRKQAGQLIRGEQEAYSKEEVELALRRMGFDDVHVEKSLIDFRMKPPQGDVITFIRLSADLLREKLPFDEILTLLETDISNKSMKKIIKEILNDLKDGKDGEEVFNKQANFLGKFPAKMLGVASKSGNMAEVYENTAIFLERVHEFKKSIRSALLMPSITMFVLLGAVIFYIGYIFPETAEMFASFGAELPPMTQASLDLSHFLTGNIIWIVLILLVPPLILFRLALTKKGQIIVGKFSIKMPIIGPILHKTSIEIFCRVFNSMYSGSGENIEVIRTAAEACRNKYMEKRIKEVTIPMMVREGKGFVESLKQADIFTENALTRFNTGAESGTLKKVSLQIARYYEKESKYKMQAIVDWIQVFVALIIMLVMTLLTVVSSETAVFSPKMPGMGM
ncbi:type II secretion system F family protein [candidate division KSB1 bacterium]|nr:type II secretion system F family protein [candidate division KSB1 bacterium]